MWIRRETIYVIGVHVAFHVAFHLRDANTTGTSAADGSQSEYEPPLRFFH